MKKLLLFFFLIGINISNLYAEQKKFKISYDPDYAPFSYIQDNKPHGLLIDFWKQWAKSNNYNIEFVNGVLWDDAINLVKTKQVDFFLGTEVYKDWMKGSKEFYKVKTSLFKLSSMKKEIDRTKKLNIGLIGKDYENSIKKIFTNANISIYKDYATIFEDLLNKRIDLLYDDKLAIKFYILENRLYHLIKPIDTFSSQSPIQAISYDKNLIKVFDEGFKKIPKSTLLKIEEKWILNDTLQYKKIVNTNSFLLTKEEKDFINSHILNISISKAWKPFSFSNNGIPSGISSDFWYLLSKKTGLKSNYNFSSQFTEQLTSIKEKSNDLIYSTGITKERKEYAIFSKPYITFPISIATLKDENFIENASLLLNKKIAVGENFTAHKVLKEKFPHMDFLLVRSVKEGLKKVSNKEAYAYVDIKPNLIYNINKEGLNNLKITGNTGLDFKLRIMIREDYPILLSILNKAIDTISEDQKNAIISKWANVQFEDKFDYTLVWKILVFVAIVLIALLYRYIIIQKVNANLKKIIEERTKELKSLNENLERLVVEKTKELVETNEILDEAQKIAHLGSYKYNIKDNILFWSDEHYRIFGIEPNSKSPTFEFFISSVVPQDKEKVLKHLDYAKKTDKTLRFEYRIKLEDGAIKYVESTSRIKYDKNNNQAFLIGTILDITSLKTLELEKRQQENLLAQQSKMAAMGEMLENIAHQWRQPLSLITTASSSIKLHKDMGMLKDEFLFKYLKKITDSSQYLSKTIDDFRNFFKSDKNILEFNIKDVIEKCLIILSSKTDNKEINISIDGKDVYIKSLESELIQVIMNLLKNAIDIIETLKSKKLIFIEIYEENNIVTIKIKDNGGGIDESIIDRIFEPYFTTKHQSQGTGIGLYMSSQIVTKHLQGTMKVKNTNFSYEGKDYKGAEFTIYLPNDISKL